MWLLIQRGKVAKFDFDTLPLALCVKSQQTTLENILFIFPRKQDLTFHVDCLQCRQTALNVKFCFLGKNKKNIINFLSAEYVQGMVKVKENGHTFMGGNSFLPDLFAFKMKRGLL